MFSCTLYSTTRIGDAYKTQHRIRRKVLRKSWHQHKHSIESREKTVQERQKFSKNEKIQSRTELLQVSSFKTQGVRECVDKVYFVAHFANVLYMHTIHTVVHHAVIMVVIIITIIKLGIVCKLNSEHSRKLNVGPEIRVNAKHRETCALDAFPSSISLSRVLHFVLVDHETNFVSLYLFMDK